MRETYIFAMYHIYTVTHKTSKRPSYHCTWEINQLIKVYDTLNILMQIILYLTVLQNNPPMYYTYIFFEIKHAFSKSSMANFNLNWYLQ